MESDPVRAAAAASGPVRGFPAAAPSQVMPLRVARREFTRARICDAAREVFFRKGFSATTLDDIVRAAGTRKSTFYTHFRDKTDILATIADDYLMKVQAVIERVPAPHPTRPEIDLWIRDFAAFVIKERIPTVLVVHGSEMREVPQPIERFGVRMLEALGARLPAFAAALGDGAEGRLALARANTVLRELGWALCCHVEQNGQGLAPEMLTVAAELFDRFVNEETTQ